MAWRYWEIENLDFYLKTYELNRKEIEIKHVDSRNTDSFSFIEKPSRLEFSVRGFPGQCGVMTIYSFEYRRSGNGPLLRDELMQEIFSFADYLAVLGGYSKIMASHVEGVYLPLFLKNGYTEILKFKNKRTNNEVSILAKDV